MDTSVPSLSLTADSGSATFFLTQRESQTNEGAIENERLHCWCIRKTGETHGSTRLGLRLESNRTRRIDFALFMVEALGNHAFIGKALAIVGYQTPSALVHPM